MKSELFSVWSAQRDKDVYVQYHSHDYYELVFYCSGSGAAHIDEEEYHFKTDDLVLIPPHVRHDERHYERGKVICVCFYCDLELTSAFYNGADNGLKSMINEMLSEALSQSYGYSDMLLSLLTALIIKMMRNRQKENAARKNNFRFIIKRIWSE